MNMNPNGGNNKMASSTLTSDQASRERVQISFIHSSVTRVERETVRIDFHSLTSDLARGRQRLQRKLGTSSPLQTRSSLPYTPRLSMPHLHG